MMFLGGVRSLDPFLEAYITQESKGFFPYEWFVSLENLNKQLPSFDAFVSILSSSKQMDKDDGDFENLIKKDN